RSRHRHPIGLESNRGRAADGTARTHPRRRLPASASRRRRSMSATTIEHHGPATGRILREAVILTGRAMRHWRARPITFSIQLLFPVLVMLLMGGLLRGAIAVTPGDDSGFVVPALLAFTGLPGIETTIAAGTGDAAKTVTGRFRTLPSSRGSGLLGRVFADMLTAAVELAVVTAA